MCKWRTYEVWVGRRGVETTMLFQPFKSREIADRVREHQEKTLNEFADPGNPWRVWVESKKERPNDLWKRTVANWNEPEQRAARTEDTERSGTGDQ